MQISAVVITLNEERNIARCLSSLDGIADEVIVVDSLSTDKTKEICLSYPNVKFIEQKWLGYAQQKNYANSLASFDYIFSIDADEALSEELKQSILTLKNSKIENNKVYSVNRLTNYCGKWIHHCGWYPDSRVRLFHKSVKWEGDFIHETLSISKETEIKFLKGDLLHYSYHTTTDHLLQVEKFTTLTSKEAFSKGKTVSLLGLWLRPKWKFFRDYILNLGIFDGYAGYQVCKISAFATYIKYAKLRELNKK